MQPTFFRVALLFFMIAGRSVLAQQPSVPNRHLRVELKGESPVRAQRVAVAPGQATVFLFDSELRRDGVSWEGREHLSLVEVGERSILMVPASSLTEDTLAWLTVRFQDGAVPESVVFPLVAQAGEATHQVEVHRYPRSAESYQREAQQERERAQRCEEESAQLRAGGGGLEGLTVLFAGGDMDARGVRLLELNEISHQPPEEMLRVRDVASLRSRGHVAVAVKLRHPGDGASWSVGNVHMVGERGEVLEVSVWQRAPLAPGEEGWVFIEVRVTEGEARGTYSLALGERGGARAVHLESIRFPE